LIQISVIFYPTINLECVFGTLEEIKILCWSSNALVTSTGLTQYR